MDAGKITGAMIRAEDIEAGHIDLQILDLETGAQGYRHLYSDRYKARWPRDQYPEKYEEDTI